MTNECAICYVGDLNFLLPTIISAVGVRRFVPVKKADIFIFLVDSDSSRLSKIDATLRSYNIRILPLSRQIFGDVDWARSNKTHVPLSTLGRFFLDEYLPEQCRKILYLDGDTWIAQDPSALIELPIPEGKFAAAEDISFFCLNDITPYGSFVRKYFSGLGLDGHKGYFNAGVFSVRRSTWRTIAKEALLFFKDNIDACKFHDQSALNAVIGDRRLRLSPKWNFQTPYRYWDVERSISPAIYHFTGGPKPWTGPVDPWADLYLRYQNAISEFSALNLPIEKLDSSKIAHANAHSVKQRKRLKYELCFRLWARRRKFRKLDSQSVLLGSGHTT
jgi:lipopolysaccharide biosynthesis glycosyltransferase